MSRAGEGQLDLFSELVVEEAPIVVTGELRSALFHTAARLKPVRGVAWRPDPMSYSPRTIASCWREWEALGAITLDEREDGWSASWASDQMMLLAYELHLAAYRGRDIEYALRKMDLQAARELVAR